MAEVKWIKIVTDIFDDDKILLIESMPEADAIIVIWFKLLCLAGKQNNSGVFLLNGRIAYTDEMFATIFRRPLNTVRLALKTFEQFGMIEIINDTVTIPNWGKHQNLDKIEAKNEYMRTYMRDYREKQKQLSDCKVNCKTNSKSNVSEADTNREEQKREEKKKREEEVLARFSRFWSAYPNKVKKSVAEISWAKLSPDDALTDTIIADVERRKKTEWSGDGERFIPHPTTYLNQHRWEDETAPTERKTESKPNPALDYAQRTYTDKDFGDDFFIDLNKYGGDSNA